MKDIYSLYEAKARLSAIVRQVREGRRVVITLHGKPVAEVSPFEAPAGLPTLAERLEDLESGGALTPAVRSPADPTVLRPGPRKPGALRRFLEERE